MLVGIPAVKISLHLCISVISRLSKKNAIVGCFTAGEQEVNKLRSATSAVPMAMGCLRANLKNIAWASMVVM